MKLEVKKSEILKKSCGVGVYKTGYCELKVLDVLSPTGYTAGIYGWNCDVYNVKGYILTTGYRPFGQKIDKKYIDKCNKDYDTLYNKYKHDKDYKYNQYIEDCNYLLKDFINDAVLKMEVE